MKIKYNRINVCILLAFTLTGERADANALVPFCVSSVPENASKRFLCFVDDAGKIIRLDAYGIESADLVLILTTLCKVDITFDDKPVGIVSCGYYNLSFVEVMAIQFGPQGFEVVREPTGVYRFRKRSDSAPQPAIVEPSDVTS